MSYADSDDVKSLFRDLDVEVDSAFSTADMTLHLENTTEVINAKVGTLYVVPINEVDSPKSFKILKQVQMFKVAGIIENILFSYNADESRPNWSKKAEELMMMIVPKKTSKGYQPPPTLELSDATLLGTTQQKNSIKAANVTLEPQFKRGQDNW